MPETIECDIPPCIDVPKKRWEWHWKQFERARFPSYNRNRSLFGRMLNQVYEVGIQSVRESMTFEGAQQRAGIQIRRQAPDIIERTYRTVYENTAGEFALGFDQNLKQLDEDDEDLLTLSLLAVRDYFTARLFTRQRSTLNTHINAVTSTHARIFSGALRSRAAIMLGLEPNQPVPPLDLSQLNQIALATRNHLKTNITPVHSRYFSTTETVAASNLGILAVARAQQERTGQVITKMWLSQRDSRVRHTHIVADGANIPLDGLFNVGGSLLAFPGDWTHGAQIKEIINCRCVLIFFSQN